MSPAVPSVSWAVIVAVIAALFVAFVFPTRANGGAARAIFRGIGIMIAVLVTAWLILQRPVNEQVGFITGPPAATEAGGMGLVGTKLEGVDGATPPAAATGQPSTEQMWADLTEARIKLDENSTSEAPTASAGRPAWVDDGYTRVGLTTTKVVSSEPFTTVDECYEQLEKQFYREVWQRLKEKVPEGQRKLVADTPPAYIGVPLDFIMREICKQEYTETFDSPSVGEMKRVYVQMEFTPQAMAAVEQLWQTHQRDARLANIAKIAALIIVGLAAAFGLMQLDTATRGYYSKRLLVGGSAAIIAVAAALFLR